LKHENYYHYLSHYFALPTENEALSRWNVYPSIVSYLYSVTWCYDTQRKRETTRK